MNEDRPIKDGKLIDYAGESVMRVNDREGQARVRAEIAATLDFSNLPELPSE